MATLTINSPSSDVADRRHATQDLEVIVPARSTPAAKRSIGQVLWIGVPLTMVSVCAATIIMFLVGGTPLGEAIGYGTYLAVWVGGGFGVMISGAYYNHVHDGLEG
jgi:hypothetical protein